MTVLILGLLMFLGVHSVRIFAEGWRTTVIQSRGEAVWKGAYSALSVAGLVLIVWGYGLARETQQLLWTPPRGMNHLAALLTLIAFVLLVAAQVPRNHIKARLKHPQVLGVKTWALAHLLANGSLSAVLLFGSFLLWAVLSFRAARQRDRAGAPAPAAGTALNTVLTVVIGVAAWAAFAFWAHGAWIGVRPLG